jgi:hypothetical protein
MRKRTGAALVAALSLSGTAAAQDLVVRDGMVPIARHALPVCLVWNHSVTGGLVADCFAARDDVLVLERSYLHDFSAGLGEISGRGTLHPATGGGYWIEGIAAPMPDGVTLRLGGANVAHRLMPDPFGSDALPLPRTRRRVTLSLTP